jgi:hypothetical protein
MSVQFLKLVFLLLDMMIMLSFFSNLKYRRAFISLSRIGEEEEEAEEEIVEPPDVDWPSHIPLGDSHSEDILVEPVDFIMPYDEIDPWKRFMLKSEAGISRSAQEDKSFWRQFRADLLVEAGEMELDEYEGLTSNEVWMLWNAKPPLPDRPFCAKVYNGWLEHQEKTEDQTFRL